MSDPVFDEFGNLREPVSCHTCRHLHPDWISCDAFPDMIPLEIQRGDFDHRNPHPLDGGIQYEEALPDLADEGTVEAEVEVWMEAE